MTDAPFARFIRSQKNRQKSLAESERGRHIHRQPKTKEVSAKRREIASVYFEPVLEMPIVAELLANSRRRRNGERRERLRPHAAATGPRRRRTDC
jgi:hypothetical protein